jgi:hypothetical protein
MEGWGKPNSIANAKFQSGASELAEPKVMTQIPQDEIQQQVGAERTHHPQLPAADLRQTGHIQPRAVDPVCGQRYELNSNGYERVTRTFAG